jgi:hypothetical protein
MSDDGRQIVDLEAQIADSNALRVLHYTIGPDTPGASWINNNCFIVSLPSLPAGTLLLGQFAYESEAFDVADRFSQVDLWDSDDFNYELLAEADRFSNPYDDPIYAITDTAVTVGAADQIALLKMDAQPLLQVRLSGSSEVAPVTGKVEYYLLTTTVELGT